MELKELHAGDACGACREPPSSHLPSRAGMECEETCTRSLTVAWPIECPPSDKPCRTTAPRVAGRDGRDRVREKERRRGVWRGWAGSPELEYSRVKPQIISGLYKQRPARSIPPPQRPPLLVFAAKYYVSLQ
jgi:hypothetical protein